MADTCNWPLGNGETLEFNVHDRNTNWKNVGGLYIFTCLKEDSWFPLYVGQAEDLSVRLPNHEKLEQAIQLGATHIHARAVPRAADRIVLEKMLIDYLQPPMNIQGR